jgi:restriction system protein
MARGFFAEIQHQQKVAARKAEVQQRAASREHEAAVRRREQARKAEERAIAAAGRASEAERKKLEREAKAAHVAAMLTEVEERNAALAMSYDDIDSLLAWTLDFDDHIDLETLRRTVEHPPFDRPDLETPLPPPPPIPEPPEPQLATVEAPSGMFGRKKKQAEALAAAEADLANELEVWRRVCGLIPAQRQAAAEAHTRQEAERQQALAIERQRYDAECSAREAEVAEHNASVDTLIANLGYGTVDAVQEYVAIVLSNSVYPDEFEVEHEATFEPTTAELRMRALVPGPEKMSEIKAYKYTKASDEITTTALSQKACKDRYAGAIHQTSLRSLHEIFEADRRGLIQTISLEVGTETIDPATGNGTYVPLVAVAADRETFLAFDLSAVVPAATLEHLGAAISKNPYGLVAIDPGGVRRS